MKDKKWIIVSLVLCLATIFLFEIHPQATTTKKNQPLDGVSIVLDSGHGGKDNGASREGAQEDAINLEIATELKQQLEQLGAAVTMTREGDYDLASPGAQVRKREDMQARRAIIDQEGMDLFVSIHLNAFANPAVSGAHVFYQKDQDASNQLAQVIQEELNGLIQQEKESKMGDYYILNETKTTGVLIECGFLSNEEERNKLQEKAYQKELARAICKGIQTYFSVLG